MNFEEDFKPLDMGMVVGTVGFGIGAIIFVNIVYAMNFEEDFKLLDMKIVADWH